MSSLPPLSERGSEHASENARCDRAEGDAQMGHPVDEHHCITCSDEGIPMRVVRLGASPGLAWCVVDAPLDSRDDPGDESEVMTLLVDPVSVGDTLLVHAGTALIRVDSTSDSVSGADR